MAENLWFVTNCLITHPTRCTIYYNHTFYIATDNGGNVCGFPIQESVMPQVRDEPPVTPDETRRDIPCTEHSHSDAPLLIPSELML